MKLRYILYRIGAEPRRVELDEALQLAEIYAEEAFCPFSGETA
jgi:hypothetical protein